MLDPQDDRFVLTDDLSRPRVLKPCTPRTRDVPAGCYDYRTRYYT